MHLLNGRSLAVSYQPSHWTHSSSNSGSVRFKIIPKDSVWIQTHDHPHSEALTINPQGLVPQGDTSLRNMAVAGKLEILVIPLHHESCRATWCFYHISLCHITASEKVDPFLMPSTRKTCHHVLSGLLPLGPWALPSFVSTGTSPPNLEPCALELLAWHTCRKGAGEEKEKRKVLLLTHWTCTTA